MTFIQVHLLYRLQYMTLQAKSINQQKKKIAYGDNLTHIL